MSSTASAPQTALAPTIVPLGLATRPALALVRAAGFRAVQLGVTGTHRLVPRQLGASARRDLASTLRRMELQPAGIDCWIPPEHLQRSETVDRAVGALIDALHLAADLSRCPLSTLLPDDLDVSIIETLAEAADRSGVVMADHAPEHAHACGRGVDPALLLAQGMDPVACGARCEAARISDLAQGQRCEAGSDGGRLDLVAYRATLDVSGPAEAALDLRQLTDPRGAMERIRDRWSGLHGPGDG